MIYQNNAESKAKDSTHQLAHPQTSNPNTPPMHMFHKDKYMSPSYIIWENHFSPYTQDSHAVHEYLTGPFKHANIK